jgi:hypothetical protein
LNASTSPLNFAAVNPGGNLVDAAILGNFKSSNHGLSFTRFGSGARRGLKFILGSWLLGKLLNHEERSKHCDNQNDYQCFILRPFVSGSCLELRGYQPIAAAITGCHVDSVTAPLSTHPEVA